MLMLSSCGGGESEEVAQVPTAVVPVAVASPTRWPSLHRKSPPNKVVLGTATTFAQQAWDSSILETARSMSVTTLRDGVEWDNVEASQRQHGLSDQNLSVELARLAAPNVRVTTPAHDAHGRDHPG